MLCPCLAQVKLAQMFGTAIPDVEFAVSTADDPSEHEQQGTHGLGCSMATHWDRM